MTDDEERPGIFVMDIPLINPNKEKYKTFEEWLLHSPFNTVEE